MIAVNLGKHSDILAFGFDTRRLLMAPEYYESTLTLV